MIKKIIIEKTGNSYIQFFRYIFVGGLAALLNISIYSLSRYLIPFFDSYFIIASIISTTFGLVVNYILSLIWIFPHRNIKNKYTEFLIFVLIGMIGIVIESGLLKLFDLGIHNLTKNELYIKVVPKILSVGTVFLWNFFLRKFILFNPKDEDEHNE